MDRIIQQKLLVKPHHQPVSILLLPWFSILEKSPDDLFKSIEGGVAEAMKSLISNLLSMVVVSVSRLSITVHQPTMKNLLSC